MLLSITLHGVLLLLPMPQWWSRPAESEPEIVIEQSGAISLTTLPVIPQPESPPAPETAAQPKVNEPPVITQMPENVTAVDNRLVEDTVADLEDEPDSPVEEDMDVAEEEDIDSPPREPEAGIAFQFSSDFPHLTGSQAGCFGLENCRVAEGQNYIDALQEIRDNLETQGYVLTLYEGNDDSDVRNHRIYEMSLPSAPDDEVKYLNVFGDGLRTAIYIITSRIVTQEELQTLGATNQG